MTINKKRYFNYLVEWASEIYIFQYYHKIGIDVIKDGELVCDLVYLNTLSHFKKWYAPYREIK